MVAQRRSDSAASAGHVVDDARREAHFLCALYEVIDRERSEAGRLDHDRVAANERGHHLPGRNGHREVPGGYEAADADGLAHRHRPLVGKLRGGRLAELAAAFACPVQGAIDAFLDVAASLLEYLAHFARCVVSQLFLVLLEPQAQLHDEFASLRGRDETPLLEGLLGRLDRRVDVLGAAVLEMADDVPRVSRVDVHERLARLAGDPLAVDKILVNRSFLCHDIQNRRDQERCWMELYLISPSFYCFSGDTCRSFPVIRHFVLLWPKGRKN